jgi:hypothetical protein
MSQLAIARPVGAAYDRASFPALRTRLHVTENVLNSGGIVIQSIVKLDGENRARTTQPEF